MKNTEKILEELTGHLQKTDNIHFAYLFGSFGGKHQTDFSDIDIAIYSSKQANSSDYRRLEFKIEAELSNLFPELKFDVRSLNDAPIIIVGKILDEGKLLFARNKNKHDDYVELSRLKYMDYQIIYKPLFDYRYKQLLNDR